MLININKIRIRSIFMKNQITMVDRAGEILDYLYKSEESTGVSKLSRELDLPKATAFRILTTLEKWGIVEKDGDSDNYKLGLLLIKYGAKVSADLSIVEISKPIVDKLAIDLNESVNLSIEHQGHALNILRSFNENSVLASRLNPISPLNCSSSGKIFLTTKTDEELTEYFNDKNIAKLTINSVVDYARFLEEKDFILKNGFSYDKEEYEYGLSCVSTPIYHKNKIVAAISVSGPTSRLEIKGFKLIEESLKKASETISNLVEYLDSDRLL